MNIRAVGAELLHLDRRTDMKLIVAFRNLASAPDNKYKGNKRVWLRHENKVSFEM